MDLDNKYINKKNKIKIEEFKLKISEEYIIIESKLKEYLGSMILDKEYKEKFKKNSPTKIKPLNTLLKAISSYLKAFDYKENKYKGEYIEYE